MPQIAALLLLLAASAAAHEHDGDAGAACDADPDVQLLAAFRPGLVTVDGHADDWAQLEGSTFSLLPALDFDQDKAYGGGQMIVKAAHDGNNVFFLLQVDGNYVYSKGDDNRCASVALMFQVGQNASYQNMGGCADLPGTCTDKSCRGHEVDIMHFSIGNAIPGRLYGGNPVDGRNGNGNDSFGHLVDIYAWNPHCRYLDGIGPSGNTSFAQNDWNGAWWHSSLEFHSGFLEDDSPYGNTDQKGTYFFEFSRPLRTLDRLQQDVQFTIGQASKFAVAFWYPTDGNPWSKSQHYSASCNWLPLNIALSSGTEWQGSSSKSWDAATAFALLLSVMSFCLVVFIGYWVSRTKSVPFTPIEMVPIDRM